MSVEIVVDMLLPLLLPWMFVSPAGAEKPKRTPTRMLGKVGNMKMPSFSAQCPCAIDREET